MFSETILNSIFHFQQPWLLTYIPARPTKYSAMQLISSPHQMVLVSRAIDCRLEISRALL